MLTATSTATLASVALAAGALPAWRAARLDPMRALREEWSPAETGPPWLRG